MPGGEDDRRLASLSCLRFADWSGRWHGAAALRRTGHDRIHVIGPSPGSLIARYYVQCLGGDARVVGLVPLGTPHGGTAWSRLAPRWLPPASILAVYSDLDQLVVPAVAGRASAPTSM